MVTENRIVTVTVSNDPTYLGDATTVDDVSRWADNICEEIESRFGVSAYWVWGYSSISTDCDDPEIREWLREISQTDEWQQYL